MSSPGTRAQPFYCPYCGETDILPGDDHGSYHCQTCDRLWSLSYRGLAGATVE